MAKTIQVFVNTGNEDNNQVHQFVQGSGDKGKPTRIKAVKGARYQLKDPTLKDVGPEYIRSKRVGKNLHVSLDGSNEADLIIEGYYDEGYLAQDSTGLYGKAEDGQLYEYIPEDPTTSGLSANLVDGAVPVSQVLGGVPYGEAFALSALPLVGAALGGFAPLLVGAGLLGAAALAANRNNNDTPAAPSGQTGGLSSDSDTGSNNADGITNNKTPSYSGKAAAGSTVEVTINGKTYTTVADANGNYTVKIPAGDALPDGTYTPTIKVTNANGTTTSNGTPFTIDTSTTGTGGLTHDAANDTGSNPNDNITNNTKPTFSGTGEPGATVKIVVDGQTLTAVVGADGKWVASGPYTGNGLTGGQHAVVITFTDVAGNTSTVNAAPVFISTGIANITLSVDAVTADNTISGTEASLNGNTDITGKASGEFKAGQIVTLTINGKTFSGPVDGTGAYKISVPTADLLADPDKTIAASIAVTDTAGNAAVVSTTHPYLADNTPPNANTTTLTINSVTTDNIVVGAENVAGVTTNITGKAFGEFQAGDKVTLTINGKNFFGTVAADGTYSIPVPVTDLAADPDTKIDATLDATDRTGNKGNIVAAHTYVVDTVGPNIRTTALVLDAVTPDNLISGTDTATSINITGKASGEFKAGDKVSFTLNGTRYEGAVDAAGNFSIPVAKTDLTGNTPKIINASLLATDANGNQGTVTNDHPYAVDTTGPSASTTSVTVNAVTADNLINATEAGQTNIDITGRVTGEFTAGDIVTLSLNANGVTKTFSGPVDAAGNYTIPVTTADLIADTDKTIASSVVATDAAGNTGTVIGNTQTYLLDNVGPNSSGTTLIIDAVTTDNIVNVAESQNTNTTVTGKVVGEFTAGDTVTLRIHNTDYSATVAANGTYSVSVQTNDLLADGDKTIAGSIVARDASGNTGTISATRPYIVDVTAPNTNPGTAAINVDPVTTDNLINSAGAAITNTTITGTVTGEFKAGDIVTLTLVVNGVTKTYEGPVALATGSTVGTYSISVPTSDLVNDSDKTIVASVAAHDVAGNVGTVSTTQNYAVDTVNPSAAGTALSLNPVTADNIINVTESGATTTTLTGKVTGVFTGGNGTTTGDVVSLTVNGNTFTGRVDTNGNYSIAVTTTDLLEDLDKTVAASIVATSNSNNTGTITADTQTYTVDTTPPSATTTTLTVDVVTPDNIINTAESSLANIPVTGKAAGTFTAGDTVTLTINNKTFTGNVAADGSYSINVPATDLAADSDKKIDASIAAHDAADNLGTVTSARAYAVDTVAPSNATTALTLDPITADNIINISESGVSTTTVTGKASGEFKAGDVVTLSLVVGGITKTVTTTVNAAGNFSVNVPTSDLVNDGDKTIVASLAATDAAGNVATAGSITADQLYVVDTLAPANTALRIDAVTADDIINAAEAGLANLPITGKVTGEFTTGDVVTLTINGKPFTGSVDVNGNYSINVPTTDLRADPDLKIDGSIFARDAAGNTGTFSATRPYLVDNTGPSNTTTALSVNVVATDDTINAAESGLANIPVTGKVTGEFKSGDIVTLTVNGKTFTGPVDANGNYSINVATADLLADPDKTIAASIVATDAVGNTGTISAAHPYLVDTTPPSDGTTTISVNVVTPDNIINSSEATQTRTSVTGKVAGEFTAGDIVTITVNGNTATGTLDANGNYTVSVLTADLVAETGKTLTASVAARDPAGNIANVSTNHRYALDTTAPNGGAALGLTIDPDTNNDGTIGYTELPGTGSLNVTATFDKTKVAVGDIVTFTPVGGTAQTVALTQAMVDAGKVTVAFATPANGSTLDVTATLSDVAGNATVPARDTATINSTNPNATATIDIAAITTDSGTAGDFVTNDTTLTYSGTLTGFTLNGDKVKVELLDASGNVVETQTVTPTSATTWTFTPTAAQAAGNYTLRATIVDAAGTRVNATAPVNGTNGGQDTQLIVIDTVEPNTTVNITGISEDSGVSATDFITKDNNGLTVSATLSTALLTGEKLFYSRDNGVTWIDITSSVNGTAVTHIDSLLTSTTTVQMRVQDVAGNTASADSQLITIDTTAPTPVVNPEDPLNPPAGKASLVLDSITADNIITSAEGAQATVPVTGTARGDFTAGDTVTLTINNKTFTGTVASNGTFSINVPGADLLADSDAKVVASLAATDRAGNVGTVTDDQTYTVTTTAPNGGLALGLTIDADTNNDGLVNFTEIGNTNGTANSVLNVSASFNRNFVKVGDIITFTPAGGTAKTVTLTATDITNGFARTTFASPGDNATFNVKATITDGTLGNTGPEATDSARFDLSNLNPVSPSTKRGVGIEITSDTNNDSVLNTAEINGSTTANVKVTLPTDAKEGDVLVITGTGNSTQSITLAAAHITAGFITTTFSMPANGNALQVTAQVTDAAGNTSNLASDTATVNTTPVGSPTVEITTDTNDSGFISRAELGSATTISVKTKLPVATTNTAGAAAGDTITVTDGTTTQTHVLTQADINAGFVTDTFAKPVEGGTINVSATLTNSANNTSPAGTDRAVLDTSSFVDPTDPTKSGLKVIIDTDTNNDGNISTSELTATFKATVTLPAQAAAGDTLTFNASGNNPRTITLSAADITAGKVEVTGLTPSGDGTTFNVSASLVDRAGNATPTPDASDSAVIKTSAPNGGVAPTVEITTDADNSGIVNATELNGATTFAVKGSFDKTKVVAGDQMVFSDGTTTKTVILTSTDIGNGFATTTFTKPATEGGTLTVSAALRDTVGNSTPSSVTDSASLDTTAPNAGVAPIVTIFTDTDNSGVVNATELNNATTFTVRGAFSNGAVAGDKVVFTAVVGTQTLTQTVTLTSTDITNGFAQTTFTKPAEDGSMTVTALIQDAAGNKSSVSASDTASLDTTAPNGGAVPTVEITTDADNNQLVSSAELAGASTFNVKGSFDKNKVVAGDKLIFSDGSATPVVVTLTATDISNGFATTTFNKPSENGSLTVTVKVQDAAGNSSPVSASDTASLDTTTPNGGVAPTVEITTDADNSGIVNTAELNGSANFTVKGIFDKTKVVAGDKLVFSDNSSTPVVSTVVLTATDISNGFATTTFNKPSENGSLTVTVKVQDAAGNSSPVSTSDTASLDTTAPNGGVAPTVQITTDADNSGIVSAAELNGATTFTLKGSFDKANVAVGDKVIFTDNSTTPVVSTVVLTADDITNGFVTTTFAKPSDGASLTVSVKVQDAAGNNSPSSATDTATLDTTAPNGGAAVGLTIDLDVPASNDGIISSAEKGSAIETSLTATFDRTLVAVGDKVTFSDGTTTKVVTLVQADITAGKVVSTGWTLPNEGSTLNVTAVLTDAAGNATPQATDSAKLDTTAPNGGVAPTVSITTDADDNGKVGTTELNGATTFTVRGDFDNTKVFAGDKLVFTAGSTVNTVTLTDADITNGFATTTFAKPNNGSALTVNVLVQDAAGNQSPVSDDDTATLDTTAPTLTITHDKTVLLAGQNSTVTFTFSEEVAGFTLDDIDASGAQGSVTGLTQSTQDPKVWTATFTPTANINDTTNVIKVANSVYTDVAGNNGTGDDSDNFEIKTEVPSVTITLADSALKAGETSLVTYTFSQTPTGFEAGDVTISGAKGTLSDPVVTPGTDNKVWTATFTPTADVEDTTNVISIAAGTYTNSAGVNGTEGTSANFTIDTKAPTLTIAMADSALVVGETSKVTFTFSEAPTGFTAADVTVPSGIGAISGLAATSNPLVWEALFTPATNVADTANIISVAASTYTDAAGNNGGAAETANFTIDTTVPTVTVEMGKSALKGGETTTVTFTFSQTPTGFDVADVDMTGAKGALSNLVQDPNNSKVWTATFTPTAQVEDATNIIKVKADSYTNASGNKGTEGVSANFTIDTLPPSTTITIDAIDDNQGSSKGTVASGGVTDDTTPTVKGTLGTALATGETVHIFDNGVDIGTATISVGSTAFTFNDERTSIVDGSNLKYTAKVFDAAGNSGTASNLYTATITTTVPTITVTSVALDTIDATHLNGLFDTSERAALIGSATLPIISGTTTNVDVGQTVSVTLNGHTYTGTVAGTKASGTWSISVTEADALLLNHGNTYDISATVSDAAGQTATDTDNKLEVKVGELDIPTVLDNKTNSHTPTLTGVSQKLVSGSPVALDTNDILEITIKKPDGTIAKAISATIGGTLPTGFTYTASTKTWSYDTAAAGLNLADGTYEIIVLATDAVPNPDVQKADISTSELIIDSTAPVFSSGASVDVAENIDISVAANAVVYTAAANDSTTGNHGATFSLKSGGDAAKFSIDATTGKVSIKESPNFEDAANTDHQYSFTVEATDTFGNKSEKAVTVNVTNVNEAPVAVADTIDAKEAGGTANGTAGTNPTGNALTNDTDVDANDTKTVKDIKASSAASVTAVNASTTSADGTEVTGSFGKLKIGADGSYVYTVDNTNATVQALNTSSTALQDVFSYTVKDAAGLTSTANITVSVKGANDAPTLANAIADTTGTVGTALTSFELPANTFADVDDSTLTLSATLADGSALPSWLTFNASTRTFSATPNATPDTTGTVSVKVTATDAAGLTANDTFNIVVGAANAAPVANPTTVNNAFGQAQAPEVTITDNQSAAYVANGTELTYTLKFSKAINAASLTASDLKLTGQDTTFASVLTKVDDTTWTYTAKAAASGTRPWC